MPILGVYAAVLAVFGLFVAGAPLWGRVPVVVRPALFGAVFATALGTEILAQALTRGLGVGFLVPLALAAAAGPALARRTGAVQFFGVGQQSFVAALRHALDDLGWRHELRVDGAERVDRVVLTEAYAGAEFRVRARDGHGTLGAKGALARDLLADVVDAMEARLRDDEAAASMMSRANYAFWAVAGASMLLAVYLL
jgi:hypothetical protein